MAQFLGTVQLGGFYNNGTILKRPTKPWRPDTDPGGAGGGLRRDGGVNPHGMRKPGRGGENRPPGASKNPLLYSGRSPSWGRSAQVSGLFVAFFEPITPPKGTRFFLNILSLFIKNLVTLQMPICWLA